jgi:ABC-type branched-subunit amino acid transport system ATPase component
MDNLLLAMWLLGKNLRGCHGYPAYRYISILLSSLPWNQCPVCSGMAVQFEPEFALGAYNHLPKFFGFRSKAAPDLEKVYELFPLLRERRQQAAGTLSGGEQQMLAIGRALMANPKVILLDEPSMGLAPVIVQEVFGTIRRLKQAGITLLLVEQFAKSALEVADYAYVMDHGSIAVEGTPAELHQNERVIAAYLG